MSNTAQSLQDRIRELQEQLEEEISRRGDALRYRLNRGRIEFEADIRAQHRALRVRFWTFLRGTRPLVVLTAPVIYSLIIPFVLMDVFVTIYQAICFRVYGIPPVRRRDYIRMDRHHLAYLNALQKLNCLYCGYCNGLIAYVREIANRTEAYWCPIKHAGRVAGRPTLYADFTDYGDGEGYAAGVARLRGKVTQKGRARAAKVRNSD